MSKNTRTILWLAVVLLAMVALLVPRLQPSGDHRGSRAEETSEILEVETLVVTPHLLIEQFATVGTILADEQVAIRSEIAGVIEEIHFAEGSRVINGQLLVQIVDSEFVAERDRAQSQVELARLREERQQGLFTQGLTSQDEYDLALSRRNVLEAELRLAEAQLAKTEIRAPFAGVIGLRQVSPGAALASQARIATLQKIDTVKMEFTVPEGYASRVKLGEKVRFRVKGSARDHEGEIYAFEPNVDRETRSLRARARSANPDGELLPGAFADVELAIREIEDALMVPAIAIIPELGSKKVFVLEDGLAVPRLVETGVRTDTEVQVIRGLEATDRVIVSAIQRLSSGLPVRERATS